MSDWFYIGLGAASQITSGGRPQQWNDNDGDFYLQMAGYNKIRQCELEEMARKNPSQFRELLGHERSPIGSNSNPDFFTVDGRNYPAGLAKDISEILAREGYKYLKNIDTPAISDAIRDPNYRKVVGIRLNNGNIPNSYLMSPEQEREWEYVYPATKKLLKGDPVFTRTQVWVLIGLGLLLSTLLLIIAKNWGWATMVLEGDGAAGFWFGFSIIFIAIIMMAWGVSWFATMGIPAERVQRKRIKITTGIMAYVFLILTILFVAELEHGTAFIWAAFGIPFILPLFILLYYVEYLGIQNKRDPEKRKAAQENNRTIRENRYKNMGTAIKKVRTEIKNDPTVLNEIPWCNNIDERRKEWDYANDCNKGDFINRYRFERYKSSFEIRAENEAERNEQLEKQRVQNIKDVCQMKEETLSVVHKALQQLEHLNNLVTYNRIVRIQNKILEETNNIESKSNEKILSIMSWLKLKKAEVEFIAKSL